MNKKFVSLMVCSLLLGGTATSLVSCSDHDDDITNLNNTTADLGKQLGTLQEALKANEDAAKQAASAASKALADAQAAAQKGDAAEAAAKQAAAQAELAKQAAATAKAEAISEVIAQLKPLIDGKADAAEVAKLAGRIDGIEQGLKNIDLTDINKQLGGQADQLEGQAKAIQTLETQVKALNKYLELLEGLNGRLSGIDDEINSIKSTVKALQDLQKDVTANGKAIGEIQAELKKFAAQITTEVGNGVNTIAGVLMQRLTAVTLMPDVYMDGIPTIDFVSAKYTQQVQKGNDWVDATSGKTTYIISNNTAEAHYRLNPGTIQKGDIKDPAYVSRVATTRAGEVLNDIVGVSDWKVENDGTLTVYLSKGNTESLNRPNNEIYTVSLKVPIADKHLFAEQGETSAAVYSEFTRLNETYFQPELMFVPGESDLEAGDSHYHGMYTRQELYNSAAGAMVAKTLVYNEKYDLYKLVEGCGVFSATNHKPLTVAELDKYGLEIVFDVAKPEYMPTSDKTNQQAFVKLSGDNNSVLTPQTSTGVTGNKVIIGKQPILSATLRDKVNDNVVAVRYFKVMFVAVDMQDKVINWPNITATGTPCEGATKYFDWKEFEQVLMQLDGGNGMSKEDFTEIYGKKTPIVTYQNANSGELTPDIINANKDASLPVMTWTLDPAALGHLTVGKNEKTVSATVKFLPKDELHPVVVINLTMKVTTNVSAASLGKTNDLKWQNGTMKVYPVPMAIPYNNTKATYKTNILEGREKPYTSGLLSCAQYDINYKNNVTPAGCQALELPNGVSHWTFSTANQANLNAIYFKLIKGNAAAEKLASNGGEVTIDWSSNINGISTNSYVFGSMKLHVVKILTLTTTLGEAFVDNSHAQTINITKNMKLHDAYGNLVAETTPKSPAENEKYAADYYKYYGIQKPVYGQNITICNNADGSGKNWTLAELNMTANLDGTNGNLTFKNNGAPLQSNAYVIVPVSIKHEWGTLTGHIAIPLNKSNAPLNKRGR